MCDGERSLEVTGVKEGRKLTRAQAARVSGEPMDAWRKKNPDANWDPAPPVVAQGQQRKGTKLEYGKKQAARC